MARVYYVFLFREDIKKKKQQRNGRDEKRTILSENQKRSKTNSETFSVLFFTSLIWNQIVNGGWPCMNVFHASVYLSFQDIPDMTKRQIYLIIRWRIVYL